MTTHAYARPDLRHGDDPADPADTPVELSLASDTVELRRRAGLAALLGAVAAGVAIAYLARATSTGATLDWMLTAVLTGLAAMHLRSFVDARSPLLVADDQGVRIRLGRTWRGLPWGAVAEVAHQPRRRVLRDGKLVVHPHNQDRLLEELDRGGRRQARVSERLYGAPLAVPLGLTTRVTGSSGDLTEALRRLADDRAPVVETGPVESAAMDADAINADAVDAGDAETAVAVAAPLVEAGPAETGTVVTGPSEADEVGGVDADEAPEVDDTGAPGRRRWWRDPRPKLAAGIGTLARIGRPQREDEPDFAADHEPDQQARPEPLTEPLDPPPTGHSREPSREPSRGHSRTSALQPASATPLPLREPREGRRTEITREVGTAEPEPTPAPSAWGSRVRPIATPRDVVEAPVIDDFVVEPADDPVIGPELRAARTRLGLSVDQLASRTRIRPHVIESIEVDDFAPCGGDFYARGHLRTLARVLGVDAAPLLAAHDDRYAAAPIDPRRVFAADRATGFGGTGARRTPGGNGWSVLVAAVMTVVLAWSVARLVTDDPADLPEQAWQLGGAYTPPQRPDAVIAEPVRVRLDASGAVRVVVRDGNGRVVLTDQLAAGETARLRAVAPLQVTATDGGLLAARVAGVDHGTLGRAGRSTEVTFEAPARAAGEGS